MINIERQALEKLAETTWDVLVIGGGISGAGVACEAARRGVNVLLLEQKDFAWGSSSRSSKMLHGGLRYLAQGHIRLTRTAVQERERFIDEVPGLAYPAPYIIPSYRGEKLKKWQIAIALGLYDLFAGKKHRKYLSKDDITHLVPGIKNLNLTGGYEFIEGTTDDTRMVLRVLKEAVLNGANVRNYSQVTNLVRDKNNQVCGVRVRDTSDAVTSEVEIKARVVINATGAWTDYLRNHNKKIRPLRGSHILITHERLPLDYVLIVRHPQDGRQVFIMPWLHCTVIGTTDLDHHDDMQNEPTMSKDEAKYLLALGNYIFPNAKLTSSDIRSCWAGVRPTIMGKANKPSKISREHAVWVEDGLYSLAGGKLTTFRLMAHDVLMQASKVLPQLAHTNRNGRYLPQQEMFAWPGVAKEIIERMSGWYGKDAVEILRKSSIENLSLIPGTNYLRAEIPYILAAESVVHLDDLLLRRLRIGLICERGGEELLPLIHTLCNWDDNRWEHELKRYQTIWKKYYSYHDKETV